ncbi:response regulator transcription factor [Agromyces bracchium]|uniref:Response regulator n=1 Tax=Agromyces bracchium TaxID=88376 RepID=A0A6I3M6T7_9MICO|nr:response regulator transcription factor [Agromyces bracchium]MTH67046.1 response regulator [Agromyces bracchium]
MTARVLVVDDQPLIRQAVRALLDAEPTLEVVGEAADGAEALDLVRELRPDVVLMDIRMPGLDGIEATRRIGADPALADVRVLILTTFEEDENVVRALHAGASGFIGKGTDPDALVEAVHTVHAGESLLSPSATRVLIERYVRPGPVPAPAATSSLGAALATLTDREREVLVLVAGGLSNDDLAERLVISRHTAKTHVNRVMAKLGAHDRAQLVIAAYEAGLVRPGGAGGGAGGD